MKSFIEKLDALLVDARAIENPSPFVGNLIGGLCHARDNAVWEQERLVRPPAAVEVPAAAAAQVPAAGPEAAPTQQ